jgi:hypothetical protein
MFCGDTGCIDHPVCRSLPWTRWCVSFRAFGTPANCSRLSVWHLVPSPMSLYSFDQDWPAGSRWCFMRRCNQLITAPLVTWSDRLSISNTILVVVLLDNADRVREVPKEKRGSAVLLLILAKVLITPGACRFGTTIRRGDHGMICHVCSVVR